ncbi:ceramide kinase isoform X2 [Lissotriton helveticus]
MEPDLQPLSSTLLRKNRCYEVTLDPGSQQLSWRDLQPKRNRAGICLAGVLRRARRVACCDNEHSLPAFKSVPVSEIVSVEEAAIDSGKWQQMFKPCGFTVHYIRRARKHRWRCSEMTFWCNDEQLYNQWFQALKRLLELQTSRPKHLLVYINPFGGKRRGKQIFDKKVAPLFSLAAISTDVIVTEHANHAKDNLLEVELDKYDGIVCVGGDGMFSEVMHGLIGRIQKDSGIDQNNARAPLTQCNIRIGIIPAGSTDCVCYATVGINDPVTSALHIIIGDSQNLDVCSAHHNNTFLKYSVSLMGYGFYGDVLKTSEKNRWMGPSRYDISGFKTFLSHHSYEGTVSFRPAKQTLASPRDKKLCRFGCSVCRQTKQQLEMQQREPFVGLEHNEAGDWQTIRGKFIAINAANMSCACPRSPKGLSPAAHLADGTADLILIRKCSRLKFLRHLIRHTNREDQFDFPFVEVYRVKKFQFTPKHCEEEDSDNNDVVKKNFAHICTEKPSCGCSRVTSIWNCDGEPLDQPSIEVGVHCQLIKLFARGIEDSCKIEDLVDSNRL